MSICVLREVFKVHAMPAGFGEIKGKTLGVRRAWRQKCKWSVPPEQEVGPGGES